MRSQLITEIALLPLITPLPLSVTLKEKLLKAKQTLKSASEHSFYYLLDTSASSTSPASILYLLGTWSSLAKHQEFLASDENKGLLQLLGDDISIEGIEMFHVDGDLLASISLLLESEDGGNGVLRLERVVCSVDLGQEFEKQIHQHGVIGGWKIEKREGHEGEEEWVGLKRFETVEEGMQSLDREKGRTEIVNDMRIEARCLRLVKELR